MVYSKGKTWFSRCEIYSYTPSFILFVKHKILSNIQHKVRCAKPTK